MAVTPNLARLKKLMAEITTDIAMTGARLNGLEQQTISLTGSGATKQLEASDSGCVVFMSGSDPSTLTLPAVADGLRFTVYITSAQIHVIQAKSNVMQGNYRHNSATTTMTRVAIANKGKLTLHSSDRAIGDRLEFWCDGTNWYVDGIVNNALTEGTV